MNFNDIEIGDVISYQDMANPYQKAIVTKKEITKWGPVIHIEWEEDNRPDTVGGFSYQHGWKKESQ